MSSISTLGKTFKKAVQFWWLHALLGILYIIIGIWIFKTPLSSYLTLAIIFSVVFLISGVLEMIYALANRKNLESWGWSLFGGVFETILGLILVSKPGITMIALPIIVGFTIMFRSFMAMGIAFDLKSYNIKSWSLLLIFGIISLIFSFIMIWNPVFGGMTIIIWTALAFISIGIFRLVLALKLRNVHKETEFIKEKYL